MTQDPTLPEPIDAAGLLEGIGANGPLQTEEAHDDLSSRITMMDGPEKLVLAMVHSYRESDRPRRRAYAALFTSAPVLAAEVVRLQTENERLRNTVGAQETAIAAVDNWLLEHGDTTHLLSRVEHLDAFMAFAAEEAVSTLKAAAEGMAEGLDAILVKWGAYVKARDTGQGHRNLRSKRLEIGSVAFKAQKTLTLYRAATSGAG